MEEAISKFVEALEAQKHTGFDDIHRLVKGLPVPVTKAIRLIWNLALYDIIYDIRR